MIQLKCKKLSENAKLPQKTPGNIGWDLYCIKDDSFRSLPVSGCGPNCTEYIDTIALMPGESHLFRTGLAIEIPEGYGAVLFDRSSMAKNQVHRLGGVIDSSYRGEWLVMLKNLSGSVQRINAGDKIIQFIIMRDYDGEAFFAEELSDTSRGTNGFGSTGR